MIKLQLFNNKQIGFFFVLSSRWISNLKSLCIYENITFTIGNGINKLESERNPDILLTKIFNNL